MPELRWILIVAGLLILLSVYLWGRRISPRAEEKETILRSRAEPLITEGLGSVPSEDYADEAASDDQAFEAVAVQAEEEWPAIDEPAFEPVEDAVDSIQARREPVMSATDDLAIDADDEPTLDPRTMESSAPAAVVPEATSAADAREHAAPAPTSPRPRTASSRKILVLRLAAGNTQIAGERLRSAFAARGLVYGKYDIFHHVHTTGETLFSVASMVEPGSFDLQNMGTTQYSGITLFAQLPGPLSGEEVFEELLSCAKQLQSVVGGTLQDDRGALLNSPRIQRIRQEIADFEHLHSTSVDGLAGSSVSS
jgi:cell division protein ZipA